MKRQSANIWHLTVRKHKTFSRLFVWTRRGFYFFQKEDFVSIPLVIIKPSFLSRDISIEGKCPRLALLSCAVRLLSVVIR